MNGERGILQVPIEQVLQAQFAKVGRLEFEIDLMRQQMSALEAENKQLRDQLNKDLKEGDKELTDVLKQE